MKLKEMEVTKQDVLNMINNNQIKLIQNLSDIPEELQTIICEKMNEKYNINPMEANQLQYIKRDLSAIRWIDNSSDQKLKERQPKWNDIQDIENPTKEQQLESVKKDGYSIQCIKDPSEEVQLEAIKQEPRCIRYIKEPTRAVKKEIINKHPELIREMDLWDVFL